MGEKRGNPRVVGGHPSSRVVGGGVGGVPPLKGPRDPFKGPRGPFEGPQGPLERPRGP